MIKEDIPYPVWRAARRVHRATASLRAFPDFLVIGAQKGGTTSLFRYLVQHPDVLPPKEKEVRYFSRCYDRGRQWYQSFFSTRTRLALGRYVGREYRTFEASSDYIWDVHAPARVARDLPKGRFILMLRDPVARAYSQYKMEVRDGQETRSFHEALAASEQIEQELHRRKEDPSYLSMELFHHSYVSRGCYLDQIRRWHSFVEPSRILILGSEEFLGNPEENFRRVLSFLELREDVRIDFRRHNRGKGQPMTPECEEYLLDYYRDRNQSLYEYLSKDFGWSR